VKGRVGLDDLVTRARQGDSTAFEQLAMHHVTNLYRIATAMVGAADARDVTQETLVAAWRQLPRLRDDARFDQWLRQICVNRCRNELRRRARHPETNNLLPDALETDGAPSSDPALVDRRLAVSDALGLLPPTQRAVVVLHYLVGLPLREVAVTLSIPEGTVKSRLNAALAHLRAEFPEGAA
jgi:RNA polymerase sigma-70 factor, ECF subfamily